MFMKPLVLVASWSSAILGALPSHAETYGTLFTNQPVASFSLDRPDRETKKWLMTLPRDDSSQDMPKVESEAGSKAEPRVISGGSTEGAAPLEAAKGTERVASGPLHHIENATAVWTDLRGLTANGEHADPAALTAAHKTLPLGARVKVLNRLNGKTVLVRINDRVAHAGMIILSEASAKAIGMKGTAPVALSVEQVETIVAETAAGNKKTQTGRSVLHDHPSSRGHRAKTQPTVVPVAVEAPQQPGLFRSLFGSVLSH